MLPEASLRNPRSLFVLALVLVLTARTIRAQGHATVPLPPASEGNVDGRQGISFWPSRVVDGERVGEDTAGCTVHLVAANVDERLSYPCGKWVAPPADRYTIWLEQGDRISDQTVIMTAGVPFAGNGVVVAMPMNDAGFVTVARDARFDGQTSVRFLSLEPSSVAFEKRLPESAAYSSNRLPVGKSIAGFFDVDGATLALSRPFVVKKSETTTVAPRAADEGADVMLVLSKGRASQRDRNSPNTKLALTAAGKSHGPDVYQETNGRIVAVWYAVPGQSATYRLTSDVFHLDDKEIRLVPGKVVTVREELSLATKGVIR
jgi:hypothetical protein